SGKRIVDPHRITFSDGPLPMSVPGAARHDTSDRTDRSDPTSAPLAQTLVQPRRSVKQPGHRRLSGTPDAQNPAEAGSDQGDRKKEANARLLIRHGQDNRAPERHHDAQPGQKKVPRLLLRQPRIGAGGGAPAPA